LKITYEDGKYGPGDKKIFFNGIAISYQYLADQFVGSMLAREDAGLKSIDLVNMLLCALAAQELTEHILNEYFHVKSEEDLCIMAIELYKNEERIHPRSKGEQGGKYLQDFLEECMIAESVSTEILDKYGLPDSIR